MVLSSYTVLDFFLVSLRILFGFLVLWFSARSWRVDRRSVSPEAKKTTEDRGYLQYLLAILLLVLNLISWPLFYLVLQSYVAEWPGVMCIYGVTRIGAGTVGVSRFLPVLVQTLQVTKPLLLFLAGTWFVFYWINRRTATGALGIHVLGAVTVFGLAAVADAVAEAAYLLIPKREEFLSAGCCTGAFDARDMSVPFVAWLPSGALRPVGLAAAFFGVHAGLILVLFRLSHGWPRRATRLACGLAIFGALVSLPISAAFLVEIAAPVLLHLPYHHCPYDLLPRIPESMVGVAFYWIGCFAVGWAALASWFARCPESLSFLDDFVRQLLYLGLLGYSGSVLLISMELVLA